MADKLAARKNSEFLAMADWSLSLAEAGRQATAQGKLIFAYFMRSYEP